MEDIKYFIETATYEQWKDFLAHIEQRKTEGMQKIVELVEFIIKKYEECK